MSRRKPKSVDSVLLGLVYLLVAGGFLVFSSASLGLMARDGASFASVASSQFFFGVIGGGMAMLVMSNVYYRHWRRYAFYFFLFTLLITTAVFIPGLGQTHAGATRWLDLGFVTVQPSEFLKIGFVVYLATWFSGVQSKIGQWKYGLLPFGVVTGITGLVMLMQPDTDTFLIMTFAGLAMYLVAGASWRDLALIFVGGLTLIAVIAMTRPYIMDRLTTFMDPAADPLGSGYQIQQSLIAVGSGGVTGRGYGQSIQKFEYLPEPIGDSVFAVYAEEFGFVGSVALILALVFLTLRGYRTATVAQDSFGALLVVGFMTIIVGQSFLNMAAMVGLAPLSGLPLPFVSHGGSALLATLASLGVVLNVSKYRVFRKRA
jgi:cell division protein FtsW